MTRREGQRIEQVVREAAFGFYNRDVKFSKVVTDLLRRELAKERRRVRRLITSKPFSLNPTIAVTDWGKGYQEACRDILTALKGR